MIDLQAAVTIVLYLIVGAVVFALLYWLLDVVGSQFGEGAGPFVKIGRVILTILAVLVCIALLLSLVSGRPIFR